jgi:acetyltransferase-like isoleucine patch superfamily enzyme
MTTPYTRESLSLEIEKHGWQIGEYAYGRPKVYIWDEESGGLVIGRYCSIADEVHLLLGGNHRSDWVSTYLFPSTELAMRWPAAQASPATRSAAVTFALATMSGWVLASRFSPA